MRAVLSTLLLFAVLAGLITVALVLEPAEELEAPDEPQPVPSPTPTSTSDTGLTSYLWVLYWEVTPPGAEFATVITKHQGSFVAPDRRHEVAGGVDAGGQSWMASALIIGDQAWEQASPGPMPTWTRLPSPPPELSEESPPFLSLFTMSVQARNTATPTAARDEYEGLEAHRYDLRLNDLPALQAYLTGVLAEAVPAASGASLTDIPVELWLRASDERPLLIAVRPAQEVLPGVRLLFNLRISNLDDPSIVIATPPS